MSARDIFRTDKIMDRVQQILFSNENAVWQKSFRTKGIIQKWKYSLAKNYFVSHKHANAQGQGIGSLLCHNKILVLSSIVNFE